MKEQSQAFRIPVFQLLPVFKKFTGGKRSAQGGGGTGAALLAGFLYYTLPAPQLFTTGKACPGHGILGGKGNHFRKAAFRRLPYDKIHL